VTRVQGRRPPAAQKDLSSLHLLFFTNAPWAPTGYGQQAAQLVPLMVQAGVNVTIAANYGLEAVSTDWQPGVQILPRGYEPFSLDVQPAYYDAIKHEHPDRQVYWFSLCDVWPIKGDRYATMPTVSWVPIDHQPTPPDVRRWCEQPNVTPVAMSKFGSRMLNVHNIIHGYAPHAIDLEVFRQRDTVTKQGGGTKTGRELMELPEDVFVVMCPNANKGMAPSRKAWPENMVAFLMFASDKPDVRLYMHTERFGALGGIRFGELFASIGLDESKFKFVNQFAHRMGIPNDVLATLYSAADVVLSPSMGEGFGICVIEAQACGTPVIVSDWTAQPELVGDGWLVEGQPWWDGPQQSWLQTPHIQDIVDRLEEAYQRWVDGGRQRVHSDKAVEFVAGNYDHRAVFEEHWRPILESLL